MSLLAPETIEAADAPYEDFSWNSSLQPHHQANDVKSAPSRLHRNLSEEQRWAVILAGGDGTRLRSLTHLICGDDRPKQFCKVFGRHTLLEQTQLRAARSIPVGQTIIALTETHRKFYEEIPGITLSPRLVQPRNCGTAPPIILSILHIANQAPDALVAILPSDHYYSDEAAFTASLESAFRLARAHPESIVLLGAQPQGADVELGWIDLGPAAGENVFRVRGFEEKPNREAAEHLLRSGALWNTFVMVGTSMAFIWMTFVSLPEMVNTLDEALPLSDENGDIRVPPPVYEAIATTDYSRRVLAPNAHRLLALRLQHLEWHDLGHPDRVVSVIRSRGPERPAWLYAWEGAQKMARDAILQP
jgi:mannose-1-phosphate guanylyltransferase